MQLMQFKPNFHVEIIDCERLVLFSEDKQHLLQGLIYVAIAELIRSCPMSVITLRQHVISLSLTKRLMAKLNVWQYVSDNAQVLTILL